MNILPFNKIFKSFSRLSDNFNIEFVSDDRSNMMYKLRSSDPSVNAEIVSYLHEYDNNALIIKNADIHDVEDKLNINDDISELFLDEPDFSDSSDKVKIINESSEFNKRVIVIFL